MPDPTDRYAKTAVLFWGAAALAAAAFAGRAWTLLAVAVFVIVAFGTLLESEGLARKLWRIAHDLRENTGRYRGPAPVTYAYGSVGDERMELTVHADGRLRLDHHPDGAHRAWTATVDPAVIARLQLALGRSTHPFHDLRARPDRRWLSTRTAEGEHRTSDLPLEEAARRRGFDDLFAVLDALVLKLCDTAVAPVPNTLGPVLTDCRLVLDRSGWDSRVAPGEVLDVVGQEIVAVESVTVDGVADLATMLFTTASGERFELIAEFGEVTWHRGEPAPAAARDPDAVIGTEPFTVPVPLVVQSVVEIWADADPGPFLVALELHGEDSAIKVHVDADCEEILPASPDYETLLERIDDVFGLTRITHPLEDPDDA